MAERVPCKTPGCANTILPATADRTGGVCMPCVQQKAREEHRAYVESNRVEVDLFAGVTDPVEVIKIMHAPRPYDPLVEYRSFPQSMERLHADLSASQIERLVDHALSLFLETGDEEEAANVLRAAALLTTHNVDRGLCEFIAQEVYYPGSMFWSAGESVSEALAQRLEGDRLRLNHILTALAWTGNETAVALFSRWKKHPPRWSADLHVPVQAYTQEGGWQLDSSGNKRELFLRDCFRIKQCLDGEPPVVSSMRVEGEACRVCSRALIRFFDLDLESLQLGSLLGYASRVPVLVCPECFGLMFTEFTTDGRAFWSQYNKTPGHVRRDAETEAEDSVPRIQLGLWEQTRLPAAAADQCLEVGSSQVGGLPTWIDDACYPDCPACRQTMMFMAQIGGDDFEDFPEGIQYAFVCQTCHMTATLYQQT